MSETRVPTAPCAKCGRPVAETAKRCIYCGAVKFTAAPGTAERAAEEAAALEEDKKLKRQAALYRAGMGMPKAEESPDQGAGIVKALLMLFVNPFASFKILKKIFRP